MATYKLNVDGESRVSVAISVPASWEADALSKDDAPLWKSGSSRQLSLNAVAPRGDDDATRITKAMKMQFDDAGSVERAELSGGRVWAVERSGGSVHARLFVPFAGGVVMGVAMLSDDAQLAEVKSVFETIQVG